MPTYGIPPPLQMDSLATWERGCRAGTNNTRQTSSSLPPLPPSPHLWRQITTYTGHSGKQPEGGESHWNVPLAAAALSFPMVNYFGMSRYFFPFRLMAKWFKQVPLTLSFSLIQKCFTFRNSSLKKCSESKSIELINGNVVGLRCNRFLFWTGLHCTGDWL